MFCGKCGNEISDSAQFCGKCGEFIKKQTDRGSFAGNGSAEGMKRITEADFAIIRRLVGTSALFILSAFFLFVDIIEIEIILAGGKGYSLFEGFNELPLERLILRVITLVIIVCSYTSCTRYLEKGKFQKMKWMVGAWISGIWCLVCQIFFIMAITSEVDRRYEGMAKVNITAGGWIYFLIDIGLLILPFLVKKNSKIQ